MLTNGSTSGFSIKPLKVKLLAGEQKATETIWGSTLQQLPTGDKTRIGWPTLCFEQPVTPSADCYSVVLQDFFFMRPANLAMPENTFGHHTWWGFPLVSPC